MAGARISGLAAGRVAAEVPGAIWIVQTVCGDDWSCAALAGTITDITRINTAPGGCYSAGMTISTIGGVSDAALWVATAVSAGLFVLRFALLMPTKRFQWRIPLAALMGIVFVLVVATIRDWPTREALGYLSVGFFTLFLASVGQGASIRRWASDAHEKGESETLQPGHMTFVVKAVVILCLMLWIKSMLVTG